MQEYANIKDMLEDIKALIVLRNDAQNVLCLLKQARISLEFVPNSFFKQILEKEIKDLGKGLNSPFFISKTIYFCHMQGDIDKILISDII